MDMAWEPQLGYQLLDLPQPLSKPPCSPLNPGKKRVWVPDEQDAYVEAEVKSEATGGRVNVETKDQKVWLSLFLGLAPLPRRVQLLASALWMKGGLGEYRGVSR